MSEVVAEFAPPSRTAAAAEALSRSNNDLYAQLQKRLAGEAGEKESCKIALHNLKRCVDHYRRQLLALVDEDSKNMMIQRGREVVSGFENEIRAKFSSIEAAEGTWAGGGKDAPGSPTRTYGVLRQSLVETQKRCESLNGDMMRQSEANEELVQTLNTVKDANKRLLEQIRQQTDEIAQLTQQRVLDEEKMENMVRRQRSEEELHKQDTQRKINALREAADERYSTTYNQLADRLRHARTRLEILKQDSEGVKQTQTQIGLEMKVMTDSVLQQLDAAQREVVHQIDSQWKRSRQQRDMINDVIYDLEVKLASEKEMRANEVSGWSHKYAYLQAEKEDIQARTTREVSQLTSQSQGLERTLTADRAAWQEERKKIEQQIEDSARQKNACDGDLDREKRNVIRLESINLELDAEVKTKETTMVELRKQIRESDDALAAAVSGNEHLRQQMEEQRQRFQAMNEAELANCRQAYEQKIEVARETRSADLNMSNKQIRAMDDDMTAKQETLDRLKNSAESLEADCTSLQRDLGMWKSQYEASVKTRKTLEKEFGENRHDFARERLKLTETIDALGSQNAAKDSDLKLTQEQYVEFKRSAMTRETELTAKIQALEEMMRETQAQLSDAKTHLMDTMETLAKHRSDSAAHSQRNAEVVAQLERELEQRKNQANEEKQRLTQALETETRETQEAKEQYDKWREAHAQSLKQVQDENEMRLTALERERTRTEERYRQDISESMKQVVAKQKRLEALENDLSRVKYLMNESQSNLNWVRAEKEREERECTNTKKQIVQEVQSVGSSLEAARRNESQIQQQLEGANARYDTDRLRLLKEIEDLKAKSTAQLAESDTNMQRTKQEFDSTLALSESRYQDAIEKEKEKLETIVRENDQLKRFIGEHRHASAGLSSLHTQLENHIQQLQTHTDELRTDLNRASSPVRDQPKSGPGSTSFAGAGSTFVAGASPDRSRLRGR